MPPRGGQSLSIMMRAAVRAVAIRAAVTP